MLEVKQYHNLLSAFLISTKAQGTLNGFHARGPIYEGYNILRIRHNEPNEVIM